MNYADLEYFAAVVQCGSLTRAADQLHITQPSISKAIGRIEEDAGATLFTRTGNRIQLNYYGKIYYRAVLTAIGTMDSTINHVKDMNGRTGGNVRIGSTVDGLIDMLLYRYHTEYPNNKLSQTIIAQDTIAEKLLSDKLDIVFSATPVIDPDILWETILKDELLLMVPSTHPLHGSFEAPLNAFRNDPFIVNNAGLLSNDDVQTLCHMAGFEPNLLYTGGEAEIIGRINADRAVTFIPASAVARMQQRSGQLPDTPQVDLSKACIHITFPECQREYGMATVRGRYHSSAVNGFHDMADEFFSDIRERKLHYGS